MEKRDSGACGLGDLTPSHMSTHDKSARVLAGHQTSLSCVCGSVCSWDFPGHAKLRRFGPTPPDKSRSAWREESRSLLLWSCCLPKHARGLFCSVRTITVTANMFLFFYCNVSRKINYLLRLNVVASEPETFFIFKNKAVQIWLTCTMKSV